MALTRSTRVSSNLVRYARVATFQDLRTRNPAYPGEIVILERAKVGAGRVDAIIIHDPDDNTTSDDDISVIVSPNGGRWKVDISEGYDARLAGINIDGTDFSSALNKTIGVIVGRIIDSGRVNNIMRSIRVVPTNFICEFKVESKIDVPSFVNINFVGSPYLEAKDLTDLYAFKVANYPFSGLTKAMMQAETSWPGGPLNQVIGNKVIRASDGGRITLRGPGFTDDVERFGVILGNDVATELDVRDCSVEDMNIFGFHTSHSLGGHFTFMAGFRNCNFSRCKIGMKLQAIFGNAGERMWYDSCTFGNLSSHCFHLLGAGTYTLFNVSCDFIGGDLVHWGSASPAAIEYLSGHIEGIAGQDGAKDTPTSYAQARIHIHSSVLRDPRLGGGEYRGIRQRFGCPSSSYGQGLLVIDESISPGMENTKPTTEYPCITGYPGNTGVYIEDPRTPNRGTPWLNSYSDACSKRINPVFSFTTSTGAVGDNLLSLDYNFACTKTGGATVEYGTSADASSDGYKPFKITLTDASEVVTLFCTNRAKARSGLKPLWAAASVKLGNAKGNLMMAPVMANYLGSAIESTFNAGNNTVTSFLRPILRAITSGSPVDLTQLREGTGLTADQFQATYPRFTNGYYQGNDFFVPGLRFTGAVGTFYVKLPVWWFEGEGFGL